MVWSIVPWRKLGSPWLGDGESCDGDENVENVDNIGLLYGLYYCEGWFMDGYGTIPLYSLMIG